MRMCPKCSKQVSDDNKICRDCGHVELRVANPEELYRHYRKANAKLHEPTDARAEPSP